MRMTKTKMAIETKLFSLEHNYGLEILCNDSFSFLRNVTDLIKRDTVSIVNTALTLAVFKHLHIHSK